MIGCPLEKWTELRTGAQLNADADRSNSTALLEKTAKQGFGNGVGKPFASSEAVVPSERRLEVECNRRARIVREQ
jgi:hypothetical protein